MALPGFSFALLQILSIWCNRHRCLSKATLRSRTRFQEASRSVFVIHLFILFFCPDNLKALEKAARYCKQSIEGSAVYGKQLVEYRKDPKAGDMFTSCFSSNGVI